MPMHNFTIASFRPQNEKSWGRHADGSGRAEIYTQWGVVTFFTFPGGGQPYHGPFTTLEIYHAEKIHYARLDRHYHERWWRRLADDFAWKATHPESA